jgi:hypothetical protein
MAYTCNLLLRTLPAIDRELHGPVQKDNTIILDIPSACASRALEAQRAQDALEAQKSTLNQSPSISLAPNATEQA